MFHQEAGVSLDVLLIDLVLLVSVSGRQGDVRFKMSNLSLNEQVLFDEDEVVAEEVELPVVFLQDDDDLIDFGALPPQSASSSHKHQIPDAVANFLRTLQNALTTRAVWELHQLYENSFVKLTEKFYAKSAWPNVESVAALIGEDDAIFLALYKELYYRHIYAKLQPSVEDRINSYTNYCDLFNLILTPVEPLELELPNQWIWDMIDEFIYQFQSFCQFKSKGGSGSAKSKVEMESLKERPDVWNVLNVLNVLYSFTQKSRINEQLWVSKHGGDMTEAVGQFGDASLYRMLGYFSIVGLLRIHCMLGDYTMALKALENIELNKKGLFARVTACHITTYYYVGFSYMMMRRYSDAIKAFAHILLFISRTKQYHVRSYQHEVIQKKGDQMYALLAICLALCPQRVDENVHTILREKYAEHLNKMQKEYVLLHSLCRSNDDMSSYLSLHSGDESIPVFEELFLFACPKFISPAGSSSSSTETTTTGASLPAQTLQQLKPFLTEVRQHHLIATIRSYLKLYTSLKVDKLASFVGKTSEELRTELLVYKHKTRQRRWEAGSVFEGEYASPWDLDFYIKQDMIFISESKVERRIGEWFVRQISKFEDTITNLNRLG
ncbi:hypothetical protein CcCBS67573_g01269 [Chytriomyces confervae]|uniref:Eukaryotic translation initiation factor 3 subunit L n=1 Tax=Chytriomyces confervae TaxID=246404 RepID=A0A507FP77_9FUNG|nr:hypothetical protein CcCBS67573_g01269 [Chytriomyces confervae]